MRITQSFVFLVLILTAFVPAATTAEVTSGADFLKIPRSARAIALGESYTAVIDDPTAIDYNPAALNTIRSVAVSMMYQTWIDNTYGLYLSGAYRLSDIVLGGSVYWFNYGGLNEYDYYGNQIGQYNPSDLNLKVALSLDAGLFLDALQGLSVGASLSLIDRNLINQTLLGFTVDAGANYQTTLGKIVNSQDDFFNLNFGKLPIVGGFVIQNIGIAAEAITPVRFSAGISFGVLPSLLVSMDLTKDIYDTPWMFKMGAEYTLFEILSLRAGFNLGRDTGNYSFGLGFRYPVLFNNLRFDYAFTPLGILGNNHNFSLYGEFKFNIRAEDYYMKGVYFFSKKEYQNTRDMWKNALEMESKNELYRERFELIEEIVKTRELEPDNLKNDKADYLESLIIRDLYGDKPSVIVNSNRAVFFYRSINLLIQSVSVTGDFNGWDTNGIPMVHVDGGWTIELEMKPGKRLYKYIVDKVKFISDPANRDSVSDGKGGKNSVIVVPEYRTASVTNIPKSVNTNASNTEATNGKMTNTVPASTNAVTNRTAVSNETGVTNVLPEQKVIFTNLNIRSTNGVNGSTTNLTVKPDKMITTTYVTNKTSMKNKKVIKTKNKPSVAVTNK